MRIALYGNVCNNMLAIARAVRDHTDHQADLFLGTESENNNLPENDYPEYRDGYPDWIKRSPDYNFKRNLNPYSRKNICKILSGYDLVILSSIYVALAPYIRGPRISFYVTGGDLTVLPFARTNRVLVGTGFIKSLIHQTLQRRGIRSIDAIITQPFSPFVNAIQRLGIPASKIVPAYLPILIDTDAIAASDDPMARMRPTDREAWERFRFRIFHPSRIMVKDDPLLRDAGQWKRNDRLLRAFAQFVRERDARDAGLYLIKLQGGQTPEIQNFQALSEHLGIADQVVWLDPPTPQGYPRAMLTHFYSGADIVADDFGAGWFGSICMEGFSCGKPVLSYVDEAAMAQLYPDHPFLSDNTDAGNAQLIAKIYDDPTFAKTLGARGRDWAVQHHSLHNGSQIYLRAIGKILGLGTEPKL